jgi:hypothetical protein
MIEPTPDITAARVIRHGVLHLTFGDGLALREIVASGDCGAGNKLWRQPAVAVPALPSTCLRWLRATITAGADNRRHFMAA